MRQKTITPIIAVATLLLLAFNLNAMTTPSEIIPQDNETTAVASPDLSNCTHVQLETTLGTIEIALYNETPLHRDNFVKLVKNGTYNGVLFHRVIKDFMIQGGDPNSKTAAAGALLGDGDLGYTIPAEIVYPKYFHKRGVLAAAREGDDTNPEHKSSSSQFYIVTGRRFSEYQLEKMQERAINQEKSAIFNRLVEERKNDIELMKSMGDERALKGLESIIAAEADKIYNENHKDQKLEFTPEQIQAYSTIGGTPHLDRQYTVYGEVVKGMDVVDKIQNVTTGANDRPVEDVRIISAKVL